jgi:zinc protease
VVEFLNEINLIRTAKVSAEELQSAKNLYNGSFALGLENPARTAAFASNILINNLPKDFYRTYLQKINAVTVDDVLRVSKKYFNHDNTRIIIVGKAESFAFSLAKKGFITNFYDNYAEFVKPTEVTATPPSNLTAKQIVTNYISAIGGEAALKKVTGVQQNADMEIQGNKLAVTMKKLAPNLSSQEATMMGQTVMKQSFNGTTGYQTVRGQKIPLSADEIAEAKADQGIFNQLTYGTDGSKIELAGTAKVGTANAYKLVVTAASGKKKTEYYDVTSGLLLKEEKTTSKDGNEITQSTEYSDYKKVGDVLFPHSMIQSIQTAKGGQEFNITVKEIKVNPAMQASDFN